MNLKIKLLKELYLENKLSHAVLIETNNQNFCVEELKELTKILSCDKALDENHSECTLCQMIEKNQALNLFIIEPDGMNIKKSQMVDLRNKCSKIPVLSKNNVYIIKNAEKFNNASANTLLKFIEEPFDNCFGFFVTNSKDNIISTIRSRCEIYDVRYKKSDILQMNNITYEEYLEIKTNLEQYLLQINNMPNIMVNKEVLLEKYKYKESATKYFIVMLDVINNYIDILLDKKTDNKYDAFFWLSECKLTNLIKKKTIIINILDNMSYNLNMGLLFDKFVIEMGEIDE